jgi:MFS family permease
MNRYENRMEGPRPEGARMLKSEISEETLFSRLIGVHERSIWWGRLLSLLIALVISEVIASFRWVLTTKISLPFSYWFHDILAQVVTVGMILLVFYFIKNMWGAALLTTIANAILIIIINAIFYSISPSARALSYSGIWVFLFIIGLFIAVRHLRPLWFSLIAGYFVVAVIDLFLTSGIQRLVEPKSQFGSHFVLYSLLSILASSIAFGAIFYAGLKLPWSVWIEKAPAPSLAFRPGEAKAFASSTSAEEKSALIKAADYKVVNSHLRPASFGSIIFGLIAIGLGGSMAGKNPINAFLVVIGICLFIEGIWLLTSPGPKGFVVDGIALIILGFWNILVTFANASSGGGRVGLFFMLGIWQIILGFQSFGRYKRFAYLAGEKPSKEDMEKLEQDLQGIMASSYGTSADIVEFKVKTAFKKWNWKRKLMDDAALFVAGTKAIISARKDEVKLTLKGEPSGMQPHKGTLHLGKQKIVGTISRESLDRLREWKPNLT